MAYVRGNGSSANSVKEQPSLRESSKQMEHERILLATEHGKDELAEAVSEGGHAIKPLVLFGTDLSFLTPMLRYVVLACGMFFFMCLYGYFQELVVYGWFQRKLSIFSTFLHFLGSSVFAQVAVALPGGWRRGTIHADYRLTQLSQPPCHHRYSTITAQRAAPRRRRPRHDGRKTLTGTL